MTRSSMPSPFMSPAAGTELPVLVEGAPSRRKPLLPFECREIEARRAIPSAEHDITGAGMSDRRARRADDQVVDAVAVDVASIGDREPL